MARLEIAQDAADASTSCREAIAPPTSVARAPSLRDYGAVTAALAAWGGVSFLLVSSGAGVSIRHYAVLAPLFAQVALVGVVWLAMVLLRNFAILSKRSSGAYYYAYDHDHPPDWVERPARAFNNLMQVPTLFYVLCALILITERADAAQLSLAWAFVALRALHAVIYMVWNHLPARFGSFVAGVITLAVLWFRFAAQTWDLMTGG